MKPPPPPPPPPGWRRAAPAEEPDAPQWGDENWGYEPDAETQPIPGPPGRAYKVTQVVGRGSRGAARVVGAGTRAGARRYQQFTSAHGADASGLAKLIQLHTANVAGDAALTVSLAGTVFALPSDEARSQVALFLALTMAPFVILAPLIGPLLDRFRHGRRWAIGTTLATRAFLAWVLASAIVDDSGWLYPTALGALVASKSYAVTRAAAVPRLLPDGITLVKANSRLTIAGLLGMMVGGGLAGALSRIGPDWSLRAAFVLYIVATVLAIRLPAAVDSDRGESEFIGNRKRNPPPEALATALLALAVVAAVTATFVYSIWSLVALGLVTGLFSQLGKLSLDALIQSDVQDQLRGRVFAWSETLLQTFWVIGGAVGIAIPLRPGLGFGVITGLLLLALGAALRSRATGQGRSAILPTPRRASRQAP